MNLQLVINRDNTCTVVIDGVVYAGTIKRDAQRADGVLRSYTAADLQELGAPEQPPSVASLDADTQAEAPEPAPV